MSSTFLVTVTDQCVMFTPGAILVDYMLMCAAFPTEMAAQSWRLQNRLWSEYKNAEALCI